MNRKTILSLHFYLSAFFSPFLLLMAITGTSYLFGNKGEETSKLVQQGITLTSEIESDISSLLKTLDKSYSYEYLKNRGSSIQTRPTTRQYYNFKKTEDGSFDLYKVEPNFLRRIIEVHKGHGPKLLKTFEKILGFCLILIILSGLFLSLSIRNREKKFYATAAAGAILLVSAFFL